MGKSGDVVEPLAPTGAVPVLRGDPGGPATPEGEREDPYGVLKGSLIMMVDDEPTTLDVLEVFLQGEGYEKLLTTTDSTRALEMLRRETPDVLLLDLIMPGVGGLELLASIRADPDLKHTPVLILTSSTEAETKLRALELGATDFLAKPVDPSELALRLRNTLAAKAYRDHLVYYDGLTGLPNRRLFCERLDRALQRVNPESVECAVLRINIDRFKQINEALGHRVGDALLREVAQRLQECVRSSDLLGILGMNADDSPLSRGSGDEFLAFLSGVGPVDQAARIARRILANLPRPFRTEGRELFVTASVGIALFPRDGEDSEGLLSNAGIAVVHAKQGGGNDYQFYSRSLKVESLERLSLENDLRRALDREELTVHYQPKVDVATGAIIGAEALLRWEHPELGFVPPGRFVPIAEESGLIEAVGEWVLTAACRQSRAWQATGLRPVPVSVNVSSRQFRTRRLTAAIRRALEESQLDGERLVLEVTESMLIENPGQTVEMLRDIKKMGVKISVDDFGTGYSSLSYLKKLPLDEIKIDQSFVQGIPADADDAAIVDAIVAMARSLGLLVVAEGVETPEQLAFLRERGCDEYQGYLRSRPVPAHRWAELFGSPPAQS